jgi:hypothetical protein
VDGATGDDAAFCNLCGRETSLAMLAVHLAEEHGIDPRELADAPVFDLAGDAGPAERPPGEWPAWMDDVLAFGPLAELEAEWRAAVGDAVAAVLDRRRASGDPRYAEPVGLNEVAGLTVAFKALVLRAGGRVEVTEAELLRARGLAARVDADEERIVVELVGGEPPDVPRFAAEGA